MTWETILVDGTDLKSVSGLTLQVWDGAHTSPELRGGSVQFLGRNGALPLDAPFDVATVSVGVQIRGASLLTGLNDSLRTLTRICKPGQVVTLTRRMSYTTGNESHTCTARYRDGLTPTLLTPAIARMMLNFTNYDGVWTGTQETLSVPMTGGTHTAFVSGDVPTSAVTLVFAGAGTLSNSATSQSITVSGATTVDVKEQTATGGVTVTAHPDSTGSWFRLLPGSNPLNLSTGGTATVSWYPAYT